MEKLEISRGTLREQLAMLEYLGVLRRRRGHGTYLDAPDASLFRTSFTLMHRLGYLGTAQFVQAREMIEESIAAEAALQVTDTDIAELRPIVDRMVERTADGDHEGALEADLQIHDYLFDTVDNPVFNMINVGLSTVLRENIRSRRTLALELECVGDVDAINTDTVHFGIVDAGEHPSSRGREGDRRPRHRRCRPGLHRRAGDLRCRRRRRIDHVTPVFEHLGTVRTVGHRVQIRLDIANPDQSVGARSSNGRQYSSGTTVR